MDFAAQPFVLVSSRVLGRVSQVTQLTAPLFSRRSAIPQFQIGTKPGVAHSQWRKDVSLRKFIKRQTAGTTNHFAESDVANIAVDEFRPGCIPQGLPNQALDCFVISAPSFLQIKVRRISGAMRQQQLDSEAFSSLTFDFRDVVGQRIAKPNLTALD